MRKLLDGYRRFQTGIYPRERALFKTLAQGQHPLALFITCADSRVVPDLITQTGPGDLFICRNVGNLIPDHGSMNGGVSATIEYAVGVLGVKDVIICGHSDCGAIKGVLQPETTAGFANVQAWLKHAVIPEHLMDDRTLSPEERLAALIEGNVVGQLTHLRTHPAVAARLARGDIGLHGWVYLIETGEIRAYDAEKGCFAPLDASNARVTKDGMEPPGR
ncbi:MAG TPA: carbonic anhydrase [Chthoniobacterales bacterium]